MSVCVYGEQLFVGFYFRAFLHIGLLSHAYFKSLWKTSIRNCPDAHLTQEVSAWKAMNFISDRMAHGMPP